MKLSGILNRIKKNEDRKTLASNFFYLSLLQVAGYIFPLLTMPYLARVLGVDKFGKIAFALAIVSYFQTFVDFGFNFTATRDIAKNRENPETVSKIFSDVLWSRFFLLAIAFVIFVCLIYGINSLYEIRYLLLATFLLLLGHLLFPQWLFQGLERMKYITILNVISKLIFTIAVFIFIKDGSDYIYQPILTSAGYIVAGLISIYIIFRKWKYKLYSPSFKCIFSTIKGSFDVFINQLFPNLYNSFSVLLLGVFSGTYANGILDAGSKLSNVVLQFFNVISRTFFPFLSRHISGHKTYAKISLVLAGLVSIILLIFAPCLIKIFFSIEFLNAVPVLRLMAISIFFLVMSDVYGTNYLIISGHSKIIRNITIVVSLIGLVISIPLVYFYSYIGAAFTIMAVRCLLGILSYIYSRKLIN